MGERSPELDLLGVKYCVQKKVYILGGIVDPYNRTIFVSKVAVWGLRESKHVPEYGRPSSKKTAVNSEEGIVCLEDEVPILEPNIVTSKLV